MFRCFIQYLLFSLVPFFSFSAGPISHVYFATMYLDYYKVSDLKQRQLFILGTLFPDIRHAVSIARKNTHLKTDCLQEVCNEKDPFVAGMKLHAFLDDFREKFVCEAKIYEALPFVPNNVRITFLKLLEDEILFDLKRFDIEIQYIKAIDIASIIWPVNIEIGAVDSWYGKNIIYLQAGAVNALHLSNLTKNDLFGIPHEELKDWSDLILVLSRRPLFKDYVGKFIDRFALELNKCTLTY